MIFYSENHGNGNAVRQCLSDKTKWFYQIIVLQRNPGGILYVDQNLHGGFPVGVNVFVGLLVLAEGEHLALERNELHFSLFHGKYPQPEFWRCHG